MKTNNSWTSPTIEGSPLVISNLFNNFPYYRTKTLSILYIIPYYIRKPLTMEGKPSLTIEQTILLYNEIPFYRRKSLTIEGNPFL